MNLVEKHIISKHSKYYKECDEICLKSKNLYNAANYIVRQEFIKTSNDKKQGILISANYLNYYAINRMLVDDKQFDMYKLPIKVSNQTLMLLDKNWKSFFAAIKKYSKCKNEYSGKPNLPNYLDIKTGRFPAIYELGAISKKRLKCGIVALSKTNIEISTRKQNIKMVRIIPKLNHYEIEIVYSIEEAKLISDNNRYVSIDLGVNNLATITSNVKEITPVIVSGKPLKSMNQFYNKKLAYHKTILDTRNKKKTSNRVKQLTDKRDFKVNDYLHKASRLIVNRLVKDNISKLVIGNNRQWKSKSDLTKRSNQNFIQIPHSRFISMLRYKCEIVGICVILQEESYTSKASFINLDNIPVYGSEHSEYEFSGYRESRGIYKIKGESACINADVNGSYNILRKAIPNAFVEGIEGLGVNPSIIKIPKK